MFYCVSKLAVLGSTECVSKVLVIVDEEYTVCLSGNLDTCYHHRHFYLAPSVACGLIACVLKQSPAVLI